MYTRTHTGHAKLQKKKKLTNIFPYEKLYVAYGDPALGPGTKWFRGRSSQVEARRARGTGAFDRVRPCAGAEHVTSGFRRHPVYGPYADPELAYARHLTRAGREVMPDLRQKYVGRMKSYHRPRNQMVPGS